MKYIQYIDYRDKKSQKVSLKIPKRSFMKSNKVFRLFYYTTMEILRFNIEYQ